MNYSICQDCGCKTSRLIFCSGCQDREKRLAQQVKALDKPIVKTSKPKVKKVEVNGTITFVKALDDYFAVKSIEGALKIGRKFVECDQYLTCNSMNLDGISMSHSSFKALVKTGVIICSVVL